MKYAEFDFSKFPAVTITFNNVEPTNEEFYEYLEEILRIYNRKEKFVLIFNASKAKYLKAELRVDQGNWIKKHEELIKKYCLGNAYIISNPIIKIVFNCILAVNKPPVPYTVFSNRYDAKKWAESKIAVAISPT